MVLKSQCKFVIFFVKVRNTPIFTFFKTISSASQKVLEYKSKILKASF